MAWLESHDELLVHPKTLQLASLMEWNRFEAVGRLKAFWWWVLKYAPTGDLSTFSDEIIGQSVDLTGEAASRFVAALKKARLIDEIEPGIRRVHDWIDYAGRYLRDTKFKNKPEKWAEVQRLYAKAAGSTGKEKSAEDQATKGRKAAVPTNLTNQPNQPTTTAGMVSQQSVPEKNLGGAVPAEEGQDLEQVIYDRIGWKRRLSRFDWDKLLDLKREFGPKEFLEACNELNPEIKHVPTYLRAVLKAKHEAKRKRSKGPVLILCDDHPDQAYPQGQRCPLCEAEISQVNPSEVKESLTALAEKMNMGGGNGIPDKYQCPDCHERHSPNYICSKRAKERVTE